VERTLLRYQVRRPAERGAEADAGDDTAARSASGSDCAGALRLAEIDDLDGGGQSASTMPLTAVQHGGAGDDDELASYRQDPPPAFSADIADQRPLL
jgi:hypothetical protein